MIILLDSYSRSVIKTDVAEIAMQGVMFVNNLAEIPDNILKENKTVIVFESYFQNNDSYSCNRSSSVESEPKKIYSNLNIFLNNLMQE